MSDTQPFVTEIDFRQARLPTETIRFLEEVMPRTSSTETKEYDCEFASPNRGSWLTLDDAFLVMTFAHDRK